jgi:hypothetical protein
VQDGLTAVVGLYREAEGVDEAQSRWWTNRFDFVASDDQVKASLHGTPVERTL